MDRQLDKLIKEFRGHSPVGSSAASSAMERLTKRLSPVSGGGRSADSDLARVIDHTALKPETSVEQILGLCEEAAAYAFASVCVNPCYVRLAAHLLQESDVAICTVIGFPLGATSPESKARDAVQAVADGAGEVDMVINVGMLKSEEHDYVEADIRSVVESVDGSVVVKVILETALLSDREKAIGCLLSQSAGADFVKTSTGFSTGGATLEDVSLMRRVVGAEMGVKASGGIRTASQARAMIAAGATRIGASSSVAIVRGDDAGSSGY